MAKKDEEGGEKKLPYPKSVFFIISTEFCERFSFYGMKSKFPNINKKKTISSLLLNKKSIEFLVGFEPPPFLRDEILSCT